MRVNTGNTLFIGGSDATTAFGNLRHGGGLIGRGGAADWVSRVPQLGRSALGHPITR